MSARARMYALVAAAAAVAAGAAVGVTLATRTPTPEVERPQGTPPLALDLGLRDDAQARALARAARLYESGKRDQAESIFSRWPSLEAQVGAAVAAWPNGTVHTLEGLAAEHPESALVQLELGLAKVWDGDGAGANEAFRAAKRADPDTLYAVQADSLLHPRFYKGLPPFTPPYRVPTALRKLPPARQLAALRARAGTGDVRARLLYGATLQQLGRPVSAERQFALAAKAAPDDPVALTAAAVGLYDKSNPSKAFAKLGPLSKRFPHAAVVRFHLGLMLVWMADVTEAREQFRATVALAPGSAYGRQAKQFLARLRNIRTK